MHILHTMMHRVTPTVSSHTPAALQRTSPLPLQLFLTVMWLQRSLRETSLQPLETHRAQCSFHLSIKTPQPLWSSDRGQDEFMKKYTGSFRSFWNEDLNPDSIKHYWSMFYKYECLKYVFSHWNGSFKADILIYRIGVNLINNQECFLEVENCNYYTQCLIVCNMGNANLYSVKQVASLLVQVFCTW